MKRLSQTTVIYKHLSLSQIHLVKSNRLHPRIFVALGPLPLYIQYLLSLRYSNPLYFRRHDFINCRFHTLPSLDESSFAPNSSASSASGNTLTRKVGRAAFLTTYKSHRCLGTSFAIRSWYHKNSTPQHRCPALTLPPHRRPRL